MSSPIELTVLGLYLTALMWIGIRSARRVANSDDYTVAGRDVPWTIVMATTAATMLGGGAAMGVVGKVYDFGIFMAVITCAWYLQLVFTGLFVAPKLRGLNLVTVGDYFELKFGPLARQIAVVNSVIFLVGALAAQMAAMGSVTSSILGVRYETALAVGAAVTIFYATVGGMRAVISTDVLQFVILVAAIGGASAYVVYDHGGYAALVDRAKPDQFQLISGDRTMIGFISLFVAYLLGETFVPPYAVRCFIARSSRDARWGVAAGGLFLLLFLPIASVTLGTAAQVNPAVGQRLSATANAEVEKEVQKRTDAGRPPSDSELLDLRKTAAASARQQAFPALMQVMFHPIFAGIAIAAIVAAVMSSADSCLSCLATALMEDIYRRHLNRSAADRQLLAVAKITTLVAGVAAALCAWVVRDITSLLEFVYDFWAPSMVLPFMVAVFWYRPSRIYGTIAAMVTGIATTIVWRFVLGSPYDVAPALAGLVAATVAYFLVWPLTAQWRLAPWATPDETIGKPAGSCDSEITEA